MWGIPSAGAFLTEEIGIIITTPIKLRVPSL
jgi:hypothetical protein